MTMIGLAAPVERARAVLFGNTSPLWIETRQPPKEISLSDPASRLTAAVGKPAFFGWSTNYLIDVKNAVIMDVAATPAIRSAEVDFTKLMIDRVEDRFGVAPKRLIGEGPTARPRWWHG
jgi:hypothetical protein